MIGRTNAIGVSQGGGDGGLAIYHVEQVINGNVCALNFTTYTNQANDNYWVYTQIVGGKQQLTLIPYNTGGSGGGMTLYHATQVISGDTSVLSFTDYNGETEDNYWVGSATEGNMQQLFIVGANASWDNIQAYKYQQLNEANMKGGATPTDTELTEAETTLQTIYNKVMGGGNE